MTRALLALLLLVALTACAAQPVEQELAGTGNPTPQGIVESFLEDLNEALADPALASPEVRRSRAERLAGHFAPSERADQRVAMAAMLASYADTAARPAVGSRVSLEVGFSHVELIEAKGDEALIRVVDGAITLRWLDENGEVVRERSGGLTEVIGEERGGLPVLRVGGRWFMTER